MRPNNIAMALTVYVFPVPAGPYGLPPMPSLKQDSKLYNTYQLRVCGQALVNFLDTRRYIYIYSQISAFLVQR
jgi:hypothetical protein